MKKKPDRGLIALRIKNHIITTYSISCHFCGASDDASVAAHQPGLAACEFMDDGWRELPKENRYMAPACPVCAKKKDKDR